MFYRITIEGALLHTFDYFFFLVFILSKYILIE